MRRLIEKQIRDSLQTVKLEPLKINLENEERDAVGAKTMAFIGFHHLKHIPNCQAEENGSRKR